MKIRERYEDAPKSFRVRADNLPAQGLDVSETLTLAYVNALLKEPQNAIAWKAEAPALFEGRLDHEADMVHVKGGATFALAHPCVRCLEEVQFEATIALDTRLLPREKDPDEGKSELDAEAFDESESDHLVVSYFDDGIIDLSEVLREQLFLELPNYPSCESQGARSGGKSCDLSALEAMNARAATIIEHPFARLQNWKSDAVN